MPLPVSVNSTRSGRGDPVLLVLTRENEAFNGRRARHYDLLDHRTIPRVGGPTRYNSLILSLSLSLFPLT